MHPATPVILTSFPAVKAVKAADTVKLSESTFALFIANLLPCEQPHPLAFSVLMNNVPSVYLCMLVILVSATEQSAYAGEQRNNIVKSVVIYFILIIT